MFPKNYFGQAYFTGFYFPPNGTFTPVDSTNPPLVGFVFNVGTMMGRR